VYSLGGSGTLDSAAPWKLVSIVAASARAGTANIITTPTPRERSIFMEELSRVIG
jgi:hypothetical protein